MYLKDIDSMCEGEKVCVRIGERKSVCENDWVCVRVCVSM